MASVQYRVPGYVSDKGKIFIAKHSPTKEWEKYWNAVLPRFESACILCDFEKALKMLNHKIEDEDQREDLELLHEQVRTLVAAETGETLVSKGVSDKSMDALRQLIEGMIDGANVEGNSKKLIINFASPES